MNSFVLGNWKSNGDKEMVAEFQAFFEGFEPAPLAGLHTGLALPYHLLNTSFQNALVGAENVSRFGPGAFTGEITAEMLKDTGVAFCLVGHSERRQYFGENEEDTGSKLERLLAAGVLPVLCIGETLAQRQAGELDQILSQQLEPLRDLKDGVSLVVAYEPVWAIGTGVAAKPEDVRDAHDRIKSMLTSQGFHQTPVLYGGSVKPGNAHELALINGVDGFLVGGASLKCADFQGIINGFISGKNA